MAINLKKGQAINLRKESPRLSRVTIGLGWDVRKPAGKGFFQSLLGTQDAEFDLDAVAVLLNEQDQIANLGDQRLVGGDVIFFNHLRHSSGDIWLTGDNRTGAGDGDDEQIVVQLDRLLKRYHKVVFLVSIYEGRSRRQEFSQVQSAYIRAVDDTGKELARFELSQDSGLKDKRSLVFAEVSRQGEDWSFKALGEAHETDRFLDILKQRFLRS